VLQIDRIRAAGPVFQKTCHQRRSGGEKSH